ncbi:hypothetical protein [Actinoplanes sp. NPDC026670]|uniref:hypothetical protein n=1 Tax=Actinoplanes sp. NPDC026670 TaxID=3154700 RepID=UPI00340571BE
MKSYHPVLAAATVLLAAGCTTPSTPAPAAVPIGSPSATVEASPSPTGPDARELLLAALEKSRSTSYRFATSGDVPDKKKITGSGVYDPKAKRISVKYKLTGDGSAQRIVVGTDLYSRSKDGETWVHLNLKKIKKDSLYAYDMTDPTGMSRFVEAVDTVASTGPNTYSGTLDIEGDRFNEGFLPVGTPAISVLFGGNATFTATTNPGGWVTSIKVTLKDSKGALNMTTTLSGHGKPSGIKKPANYGEAMDFYYD